MRHDGTEDELIFDEGSEHLVRFNVSEEWIFFIVGPQDRSLWRYNRLYRMRLDGTGVEILHDGTVSTALIAGEWIYFSEVSLGAPTHRIRKDGTGLESLR